MSAFRSLPRIGQTMAVAAIGGGVAALAVIIWRRARGPLPSEGSRPGAHQLL